MRLATLIVLLLFIGCTTKVSKSDLEHINGYWEIEKVTFANGDVKSFTPSSTIDYFEWDGQEGFRKKVQPKFDGTFETSNDALFFTLEENQKVFEIHYKVEGSMKKENIIQISPSELSFVNEDTITYTYKKYEPISIEK